MYTLTSHLTYSQYLKEREIGRVRNADLTRGISESTRQIIGKTEELRDLGVRCIEQGNSQILQAIEKHGDIIRTSMESGFDKMSESLNRGFAELSYKLSAIESQLVEANFHLGSINSTLEDILTTSRNPAHTAALEQYSHACEYLRKGFPDRAIASVERAIDGFGSHAGYALDPRFHLLRGHIYAVMDTSIPHQYLDHEKAIESFRNAEKTADDAKMKLHAKCMLAYALYIDERIHEARTALSSLSISEPAHCIIAYKILDKCGQKNLATRSLACSFINDFKHTADEISKGECNPEYLRGVAALMLSKFTPSMKINFQICNKWIKDALYPAIDTLKSGDASLLSIETDIAENVKRLHDVRADGESVASAYLLPIKFGGIFGNIRTSAEQICSKLQNHKIHIGNKISKNEEYARNRESFISYIIIALSWILSFHFIVTYASGDKSGAFGVFRDLFINEHWEFIESIWAVIILAVISSIISSIVAIAVSSVTTSFQNNRDRVRSNSVQKANASIDEKIGRIEKPIELEDPTLLLNSVKLS